MYIDLKGEVFSVLSEVIENEGCEGYVIGGYVRDLLMERDTQNRDIDIVVVGDGISIAKKVASRLGIKRGVVIYRRYGTAMIKHAGTEIEFVGARKESYTPDSRNPSVSKGTLEDDQNRRDFTINALAISLNRKEKGSLLDPFNGVDHIREKVIKTPLDPVTTFSDDPLRMMRAVRFAAQLDFKIDKGCADAIKANSHRLSIVSAERITAEFNKIVMCDTPSHGIELLEQLGLLERFFPELIALKGSDMVEGRGHKDNFAHTLEVLDNIAQKGGDLWLRWATLLHDIGKPRSKRFQEGIGWTFHGHDHLGMKMVPVIFRRLKLPLGERMRYVQNLVRLHLRPIVLSQEEVTDSAVRRLLFDAGNDIDDLMRLCEADITSKNETKVIKYLKNFGLVREKLKEIEEKDAIRNFQPPVTGEEIMRIFDIGPGRKVGILKNSIKEAILDGIIGNRRDEALPYLIEKAGEIGLEPVNQPEPPSSDQ